MSTWQWVGVVAWVLVVVAFCIWKSRNGLTRTLSDFDRHTEPVAAGNDEDGAA